MAEILAGPDRGKPRAVGRPVGPSTDPPLLLPQGEALTIKIRLSSSAVKQDTKPAKKGDALPPSALPTAKKTLRRATRTASPFDSLQRDALAHLDSIGVPVNYPSGSVVFKEGDCAGGIYFVAAGQVKLFARSEDGHTMIVKIAAPGDVLGLSATLNSLPYEVTAEAIVPSECKYVDEGLFLDFIERYPQAGYATALTIAREHREVFLKARRLALTPSAQGRISQVLVEFAVPWGNASHGFPMLLTHAELASMAGTSRETVTRLLNEFERDGIISRDHASMTILRSAELERFAH